VAVSHDAAVSEIRKTFRARDPNFPAGSRHTKTLADPLIPISAEPTHADRHARLFPHQLLKKTSMRKIVTPLQRTANDLSIADNVGLSTTIRGNDRLSFDGYKLTWHGSSGESWNAFSGQADESAKESEKNLGPIPQGKYAIDPENIEEFDESPDWGKHRVKIEPYRATVDRMGDCFAAVRTGFYVHGGSVKGTIGCIELNEDADEKAFFDRLDRYGEKIELEVRYVGERERKYEESACPY
jgi:hypothetical protein